MYRFEGLENLPIKYAISTKKDGNMSFVWSKKEEVVKNRQMVFGKAELNIEKAVTVHTSNSTKVVSVSQKDEGKGIFELETAIAADGMITEDKEITLFLMIADCVPTIFFDQVQNILALVHINGMNSEVIEETIKKFQENYGSVVENLVVSIGPSIQKESFIVDDPFQRRREDWKGFFTDLPNGRTSLDLTGYLKKSFLLAGIKIENIFVSEVDTFAENNLFSHRRSAETGETEGRFAILAKLI